MTILIAFSTTQNLQLQTVKVCSCKFACCHRSRLKLLRKIVANISLGEMICRTLLQRAGFLTVRRWLVIGNVKRIGFQRFSQNVSCEKSSITWFAISTNVDYGKLTIGADQSQENYIKYLSIVKEKGEIVMRCLHFIVFATNKVYILHIFNTSAAFWDVFKLFWWSCIQIICNYTFLRTNLTVKASVSSVLMPRL